MTKKSSKSSSSAKSSNTVKSTKTSPASHATGPLQSQQQNHSQAQSQSNKIPMKKKSSISRVTISSDPSTIMYSGSLSDSGSSHSGINRPRSQISNHSHSSSHHSNHSNHHSHHQQEMIESKSIENIASSILHNVSSITGSRTGKNRNRVNPLKYKCKLPNKNQPIEASASDLVSNNSAHLTLEPSQIYTSEVREEFSHSTVKKFAGTEYDPERFLYPGQADSLLDRKVDPKKLLNFIENYMAQYYNITNDSDAFSQRRMLMDDCLWDNLAYLIPLLCNQMVQILQNEMLVTTVEPDALVFGDIHGNFNDIYYIYTNFITNPKYEKYRFIFLGDYVDRGPKPLEILCLLFCLKLDNPKRFVLLRGNHEVLKVNRKYGFKALCSHIFEDTYVKHRITGKLAYESFNRTFTYFPVAALVKGSGRHGLFLCHGGIPNPKLKPDLSRSSSPWTVAELNALNAEFHPAMLEPSRNSPRGLRALNELLWNDPIPIRLGDKKRFQRKPFYKNKKRGGHCSFFTELALIQFLEANHVEMLIRGHQYRHCKRTGFHYDFDYRMLTLFSSSNYCGTQRNTTSYAAIIGSECQVKPHVLRTIDEAYLYKDFNILKLTVDRKTNDISEIVF